MVEGNWEVRNVKNQVAVKEEEKCPDPVHNSCFQFRSRQYLQMPRSIS
jgi:hypothetical protein